MKVLPIIKDLSHLIYPEVCLVCDNELAASEEHICSVCDSEMVPTSYHLFDEASELDKLFWGRVALKSTYAHYFFKKGSPIQKAVFNLKYKNNPAIGAYFGKEIGAALTSSPAYENAEAIIPVPLHHKKEFIRGYNQSLSLAKGISDTMGIPVKDQLVRRKIHTQTQTKKSRFQRWDNVQSIFQVHPSIKGLKHIVIVDDVVTTGSTIEALVKSILAISPETEISVVSLAVA